MSTYLIHHGIEGQKWGVRNGPPYPLSRSKSAKVKSGKKESRYSEKTGEYEIKKYKSQDVEEFRMRLQSDLMSAVLSSVPGLHSAVWLATTIKTFSSRHKNWYKKDGPPQKLSELKKKDKSTTIEEDLEVVNPRRNKNGGKQNCVYCTLGMEMRRRGYDVVARNAGKGLNYSNWKDAFGLKESDLKHLDNKPSISTKREYINKRYNELMNELESYGDGARGYLAFNWGRAFNGAHAIYWEVSNGRTKAYDGQSGKVDLDEVFSMVDPDTFEWVRLDDKKVNDKIGEFVRSNPGDKKGRK